MKKSLMVLAGVGGAATMAGGLYLWRRLRGQYERDVLSPQEWEARGPVQTSALASDPRMAAGAPGPEPAPAASVYAPRPETGVQPESMHDAVDREVNGLLARHSREIRHVWHDLRDSDIQGRTLDELVQFIQRRTGQEPGQIQDRLEELIGRPELTGN